MHFPPLLRRAPPVSALPPRTASLFLLSPPEAAPGCDTCAVSDAPELTATGQPARCRAHGRVGRNSRPRLALSPATRVRSTSSRSCRSRPAHRLFYDGPAADPSHPVEGGCGNDYAYVHGDPINQFDLDGRFAFCGVVAFFAWFSFLGDASSRGVGEGTKNQAISNGSTAVTKAALQRAAARSSGFMRGVFARSARLVGKSSSLGAQGALGVLYAGCTAELSYRNSKRWREGKTADVPRPQDFNGSGIPMCNGGRCFP